MYKAYELALKRNGPVSFKFRGVETTLYPDQLPVDDNIIEIRIKDVLKELNRVSNVSISQRSFCPAACMMFMLRDVFLYFLSRNSKFRAQLQHHRSSFVLLLPLQRITMFRRGKNPLHFHALPHLRFLERI